MPDENDEVDDVERRRLFREKLASLSVHTVKTDSKSTIDRHDFGTVEVITRDESQDVHVRPDTLRRTIGFNEPTE